MGWLRKAFGLACAEYDRLNLDREDPVAQPQAEFARGLEGLPEPETHWPRRSGPDETTGRLRPAGRVGAFRGFGGSFREPPRVATADGRSVVTNAGDSGVMTADVLGATFHRAAPAETEGTARTASTRSRTCRDGRSRRTTARPLVSVRPCRATRGRSGREA